MSYRVICVLGSSTANGYWDEEGLGWFGRFSNRLALEQPHKFGFNNIAQAGDTSLDAYHRLCGEALSRKPDILLIAVGANDLLRQYTADSQTDFSISKSYEAWQNILSTAKENIEKILVMSILPVVELRMPGSGAHDQPVYIKNEDIRVYNLKLTEWCKEFDIGFFDHSVAWQNIDLEDHIYDIIHPNAKGHQIIADTVHSEMKRLGWI